MERIGLLHSWLWFSTQCDSIHNRLSDNSTSALRSYVPCLGCYASCSLGSNYLSASYLDHGVGAKLFVHANPSCTFVIADAFMWGNRAVISLRPEQYLL